MNCTTPDLPGHYQLPEFTQTLSIESMMPSNHLILCRPLLLLTSIFPNIRVYSNESAFWIRLPNYWSFSFNISPSNEHPGLMSFRMDAWISLQSTGLSRVFSNTTLQKHQFFSFLYSPTLTSIHDHWKTIALTRHIFVDKVMSLLFNMLSRLVSSKRLLISWLQSPSAVILEPRKIKFATVSTVSRSICHEVMGLDAMILVFWMLSVKPIFHSPLWLSSRGSLVLLHFLP